MKVGMYGGKFVPFHKGHLYCLQKASEECDVVHLLLFINMNEHGCRNDVWGFHNRMAAVLRASKMFENVQPDYIDTSECVVNGEEDWDAETPLVRNVCGPRIDRVYASEPSYCDYFLRAYPEAEIIMVDPERKKVPISGTKIREMMENGLECSKWII